MTSLKSALVKGALIATVATGALVGVSTTASAYVACNNTECWHVRDQLVYPAGVGVTVHDDSWGRMHRHGFHWRADRFDHGYYRNGVWIAF